MGKNITLDNGATLTFTLIASWHDMGRERGWEAQIGGGRREEAWCDDGTMGDSKWGRVGEGGKNDVKSCFSDLPLTLIFCSAPKGTHNNLQTQCKWQFRRAERSVEEYDAFFMEKRRSQLQLRHHLLAETARTNNERVLLYF